MDVVREAKFVCEVCCNDGRFSQKNGCVVWECPHMRLTLADSEVIKAETKGLRS